MIINSLVIIAEASEILDCSLALLMNAIETSELHVLCASCEERSLWKLLQISKIWVIMLVSGQSYSPQGPAALMTASGLKRLNTDATAFTQRGGETLLTSDPWPPDSCNWGGGRSGKPHASTRMRWLTLEDKTQQLSRSCST